MLCGGCNLTVTRGRHRVLSQEAAHASVGLLQGGHRAPTCSKPVRPGADLGKLQFMLGKVGTRKSNTCRNPTCVRCKKIVDTVSWGGWAGSLMLYLHTQPS